MSQCRYCSKWGPCPEHDAKFPVTETPPADLKREILLAVNDALDGTGFSIVRATVEGEDVYQAIPAPRVRMGETPQAPRLAGIIEEMQLASDLIDSAAGTGEYQTRLVALALIARHYLRELANAK